MVTAVKTSNLTRHIGNSVNTQFSLSFKVDSKAKLHLNPLIPSKMKHSLCTSDQMRYHSRLVCTLRKELISIAVHVRQFLRRLTVAYHLNNILQAFANKCD
jgi:hypothetical protein